MAILFTVSSIQYMFYSFYSVPCYRVGGQGQGPAQGGGQQGHSVLGITANSAIGLLGLLLFINILRVSLPFHYIS